MRTETPSARLFTESGLQTGTVGARIEFIRKHGDAEEGIGTALVLESQRKARVSNIEGERYNPVDPASTEPLEWQVWRCLLNPACLGSVSGSDGTVAVQPIFVAAGIAGSVRVSNSAEAETWAVANPAVENYLGTTYGNERFVVVGNSGAARCSKDGSAGPWTNVSPGGNPL